jgi:hypothetical protein
MQRHHRGVNFLLMTLAALLTVLLLFLGYRSETFNVGSVQVYAPAVTSAGVSAPLPAAYPAIIAVSDPSRYVALGDSEALGILYRAVSVALGEALGTAKEAEEITEEEFRTALTSSGVYFDYLYDVPLDSLVVWCGVTSIRRHNTYARRFILSPDEQGFARLYYEAGGKFLKAETIANLAPVMPRLSAFIPNNGYFAFEHNLDGIDPYCLFFDAIPDLRAIALSNPLFDARTILPLFGMNAYLQADYGADGTGLYVEDERQARILSGGEIKFTRYAVTQPAEDLSAAIEMARALTSAFSAGSEQLALRYSGFEYDGTMYRVSFVWYYGDLEIRVPGATVTIDGTGIREADIHQLSAAPLTASEVVPLLPAVQAAAAVSVRQPGAEIRLAYDEAGKPIWLVADE